MAADLEAFRNTHGAEAKPQFPPSDSLQGISRHPNHPVSPTREVRADMERHALDSLPFSAIRLTPDAAKTDGKPMCVVEESSDSGERAAGR